LLNVKLVVHLVTSGL